MSETSYLIPSTQPLCAPVGYVGVDSERQAPKPGKALCLSGGGYRAMLFHTGALWRLYEAGVLADLDRISSVSGGSITAGVLGLARGRLFLPGGSPSRECYEVQVVEPLRRLAGETRERKGVTHTCTLHARRQVGGLRRR
jgi:NTE family protein